MTSVCYFYTQSCNATPIFFELGTPVGHSIGISGLKTGVESLKKGQDLEDWTAHPHQKFPGILPEAKRIPHSNQT